PAIDYGNPEELDRVPRTVAVRSGRPGRFNRALDTRPEKHPRTLLCCPLVGTPYRDYGTGNDGQGHRAPGGQACPRPAERHRPRVSAARRCPFEQWRALLIRHAGWTWRSRLGKSAEPAAPQARRSDRYRYPDLYHPRQHRSATRQ